MASFDTDSGPRQQGMMTIAGHKWDDSGSMTGGSIPGSPQMPAFTMNAPDPSPIPVIIAVPHAGRSYPAPLLEKMRHPLRATLRLEDRYVDRVANIVARATGASLLVAQAPRAMIDLNRAVEDIDWTMVCDGAPAGSSVPPGRRARSGLGLIPRRLTGLGELWKRRLENDELQARIEQVHRPYHDALAARMSVLRKRWGAALLVDFHSMPPLGICGEAGPATEFVVGDRFGASCDGVLLGAAFRSLTEHGRRFTHNRPYAGGYVLERHADPAQRLHALQMEICRTTYLDARLVEPRTDIDGLIAPLVDMIRALADETAALGQDGLALAAE